jgi:3-phosphoshikimate 1-carboxyvinyltransferase
MEKIVLTSTNKGLNGTITVPGDKSISHRAVMFGSIAKGKTTIQGFLPGEDCLSTIDCFRKLGVKITQKGNFVEVDGNGFEGLVEPTDILNVGNSGTTIRLMLGVLANTPFHSCLIGDESIAKRPMKRVTEPLREMGAIIDGRQGGNYTPVSIRGGNVKGIHYTSPVASAQVKSAVLLAGLQGEGETVVTEPEKSRDHTERMLQAFGVHVDVDGLAVTLKGKQALQGTDIVVPGDISSAAFWLVAGAIVSNSRLTLKGVGVNPTRTGIIDVLQQMGANIQVEMESEQVEPIATITIETSSLRGIEIGGEIIPRLIDEIPIIALAASQAEGVTIVKDAKELRVKETDRIQTVVDELTKLGVKIEATDDGMKIYGQSSLVGNTVNSYGDHRIGMMLAIASLLAEGETTIEQAHSVAVSYPNFFEQLVTLSKGE